MKRPSDVLPIGDVDDEELELIVSGSFPRGRSRIDGSDHLNEAEELVLLLFYDKESNLASARAGPAWSDEIADMLAERVKANLVNPPIIKVRKEVLFLPQPLEAWWRYKDVFQIVPVPSDAPRPGQSWALHPCILEFRYADAPDVWVRHLRERREVYKIRLMLSLVLMGGADWPSDSGQRHWAFVGEGEQLT